MSTKSALIVFVLLTTAKSILAQELTYTKLPKAKHKSEYTSYVAKDGSMYKVGDRLKVLPITDKTAYEGIETGKGWNVFNDNKDIQKSSEIEVVGIKIFTSQDFIHDDATCKHKTYLVSANVADAEKLYRVYIDIATEKKEIQRVNAENLTLAALPNANTPSENLSTGDRNTTQANSVTPLAGTISADVKKIVFKSDESGFDDFHDGCAVLRDGTEADGKTPRVALMDSKGEFLFPYGKYQAFGPAANGYITAAMGSKNEKWGVINYKGDIALPFESSRSGFEYVTVDNDGFLVPYKGENIKGEKFDFFRYTVNQTFSEGLSFGGLENKKGFYNKRMELVIKLEYDYARNFSEGLAVVGKRNDVGELKYGYIDKKGEVVIPFKFNNIPDDFHNGLAHIQSSTGDNAWLDTQGNIKFKMSDLPGWECRKDRTSDFINPVIFIYNKNEKKWGCLNTTGTITNTFNRYETIKMGNGQSLIGELVNTLSGVAVANFALMQHRNRLGMVDGNGDVMIRPVFAQLGFFDEKSGLAKATYYLNENEKIEGYINKQGVFVIIKAKEAKSEW